MKKMLILAAAILMACTSAVSAKNGDVIGNIYSTDIKAYVNGVQIPSYCLDGKTAFIIEDITDNYVYNDNLRTLNCLMYWLNSDSYTVKPDKTGRVLGNVYETDIVTYFRGTKIPCFALNGKTAVAIEDVGNDRAWSEYGAKYTWDGENRTISLDIITDNQMEVRDLLSDKSMDLYIDNYVAKVVSDPINGEIVIQGNRINGVHEITCDGNVIGYEHDFPTVNMYDDEDGKWHLKINNDWGEIRYINIAMLEDIIKTAPPRVPETDEWLNYFKINKACTIKDSFETDDYLFLYMSQGTPHGSNQFLNRIDKATGKCTWYSQEFKSVSLWGTKVFDNVEIDREREIVTFRYDTDYEIDLKTGKMTKSE